MSHKITYSYHGEPREMQFSYSQFRNMHEAAASNEGVDITKFLQMEQQIEAISNGKKSAARNYRDAEFEDMGFSDFYFHKDGGDK